jgi:hypothetical protein
MKIRSIWQRQAGSAAIIDRGEELVAAIRL